MRGLPMKPSQDVSSPNFIAHLQRRLGVSQTEANEVLADWLRNYEPAKRRPLNIIGNDR